MGFERCCRLVGTSLNGSISTERAIHSSSNRNTLHGTAPGETWAGVGLNREDSKTQRICDLGICLPLVLCILSEHKSHFLRESSEWVCQDHKLSSVRRFADGSLWVPLLLSKPFDERTCTEVLTFRTTGISSGRAALLPSRVRAGSLNHEPQREHFPFVCREAIT